MAATTLKEAIFQALNKAASAFYTPQTLTPEQKEQARNNIGAMSADTSPSVPAGTLLPFAGTVIPNGYLPCNGANVSRTDYANLFAAIGTKWGEGDGSTTFTLPNFNDRFIEGTTDTEKVGQYLEAGAPNIRGALKQNYVGGDNDCIVKTSNTGGVAHFASNGSCFELNASIASAVYSRSDTIQPSAGYSLIIIKA